MCYVILFYFVFIRNKNTEGNDSDVNLNTILELRE